MSSTCFLLSSHAGGPTADFMGHALADDDVTDGPAAWSRNFNLLVHPLFSFGSLLNKEHLFSFGSLLNKEHRHQNRLSGTCCKTELAQEPACISLLPNNDAGHTDVSSSLFPSIPLAVVFFFLVAASLISQDIPCEFPSKRSPHGLCPTLLVAWHSLATPLIGIALFYSPSPW